MSELDEIITQLRRRRDEVDSSIVERRDSGKLVEEIIRKLEELRRRSEAIEEKS